MRYLPVAEAAVVLGCSERTVWRRIKAQKLETKADDGRVFVALNDADTDRRTVTEMSRVAAAQLALRHSDADMLDRHLTVMAETVSAFERQVTVAHRSRRVAWLGFVLAVVALGVGGYIHRDQLATAQAAHVEQVATLQADHTEQLTDAQSEAAHAQGEADALAAQVGELNTRLAQTERDLKQAHAQERLAFMLERMFGNAAPVGQAEPVE